MLYTKTITSSDVAYTVDAGTSWWDVPKTTMTPRTVPPSDVFYKTQRVLPLRTSIQFSEHAYHTAPDKKDFTLGLTREALLHLVNKVATEYPDCFKLETQYNKETCTYTLHVALKVVASDG